MSRLAVAAMVLLISIGMLLGAAQWNRGGDPQVFVLTERELELPFTWEHGRVDDEGELRLAFRWQMRDEAQDARVWLPDLKLRELGFGTGVPAGAPEAQEFYGRSLPRVGWVAFELDGPAWRLIEQRQALAPPDRYVAGARGFRSRLVPIDAGLDPEQLRRRYRGGPVVVMPAVIELRYANNPTEGPSVWGRVARLVSADVSVPVHLRARLRGIVPLSREAPSRDPAALPPPEPAPRYEVVLGVGRLGAVWVEDVRLLIH